MNTLKHLVSITDLKAKEISQVLALAQKLKQKKILGKPLQGKQMVMIFEKPSLRTKLSFDLGFDTLGGHSIFFGPLEVGLGIRESASDIANVISTQANLIVARVFKHQVVEELSQNSTIPVINALSDYEHPCQTLADLLTILEIKGSLKGLKLAYLGDGENNVAHSLALGCAVMGINFYCASPKDFWMDPQIAVKAKQIKLKETEFVETLDPDVALRDADIVFTDTWVSMGDEADAKQRLRIFKPYQVNKKAFSSAKKDAIFMHCLPAHRGEEVTSEIIDSPQSVVFQQAENRLHTQKALMLFLLGRN